jgi:hypothetical protein
MESGLYWMEFETNACPEGMKSWEGKSCRLKTSADYLHAQEKEHDFLLDALGGSRFDAKSDRLLGVLL